MDDIFQCVDVEPCFDDIQLSDLLAIDSPISLHDKPSFSIENPPSETPRMKTAMCKHMKRKGYCLYGNTCKFAHSKTELWFPKSQLQFRSKLTLP